MLKNKLNWRRPLFYALLPVFLIMVFLGFPLPMAPPPATKARQEVSTPAKNKKKHKLEAWRTPDGGNDAASGR
jgi:hypothetical protein